MSLDRSLRPKNMLARHRNVLTRTERIARLVELGEWREDSSPLGLPKIAHRKAAVGKKDKAKKTDDAAEDGAEEETKDA